MRRTRLAMLVLACSLAFFLYSQVSFADPPLTCSADYYISQTMPNGSEWELCWEHRQREGIVYHDMTFTTPNGARREVLNQAYLAQLHVPYDDDGARYHDVTDFGLGGIALQGLSSADCPNGTLLSVDGKDVLCQRVESRGYAFKDKEELREGHLLSLYSTSLVGAYHYIIEWRLHDDGTLEPVIGATGRLQRFGTDTRYGWPIRNDDTLGLSHTHNYYWRLDFDLNGTSDDDIVEEFNFIATDNNQKYELVQTPFTTEQARSINPNTQRSWRISDSTKNSEGHAISYEIDLRNLGHRDEGPALEPWTFNDVYVTNNRLCEQFASHNPTTSGCTSDLSTFVNGETLQDSVIWVGLSFHHIPRDEDEPNMHAHWNSFEIVPRDWTSDNLLAPAIPEPTAVDLQQTEAVSSLTPLLSLVSILLLITGALLVKHSR
ncbi:MAG: hypothetical protein ACPG8W_13445 [Candidatus Promineifilaceae bacterium]